ncbi:hypothetical protein MNBD_GAMMA21-1917 [hydrothermal vent metagenome]|uniref:DUF4340 domain-containing protein n=1 Tax=hydrothermal vent metagenome TaxID=652676 RepID=A0A3B0ZB52_9ZZZZ
MMTSKSKLNIALLMAVAFLVLIVIYKPGKDPEDKYQISRLDKSSVNHIRLERIEAEPIEFSKVDGKWNMLTPYTLATTQINVESLLDLLSYNYHAVYDKNKIDLKKYGLDIPRATIIYNKQQRFDFGSTEALNKYRYLGHNDKMYVVNDYFHHRILGAATSFLDHALLPAGQNIVQIKFQHLSLKLNDGTWLATPEPENYSNDQANALIEKWQTAHAAGILKYDKTKYTDATTIGNIEIDLENKDTTLTFKLIKYENAYYLARPDIKILYKLSKEQRRDLLQLPPPIAADQFEKDIKDAMHTPPPLMPKQPINDTNGTTQLQSH